MRVESDDHTGNGAYTNLLNDFFQIKFSFLLYNFILSITFQHALFHSFKRIVIRRHQYIIRRNNGEKYTNII
jgi:hypothetical protein